MPRGEPLRAARGGCLCLGGGAAEARNLWPSEAYALQLTAAFIRRGGVEVMDLLEVPGEDVAAVGLGLGWAGLCWAGLGWAGLGWAGLGWAESRLNP